MKKMKRVNMTGWAQKHSERNKENCCLQKKQQVHLT